MHTYTRQTPPIGSQTISKIVFFAIQTIQNLYQSFEWLRSIIYSWFNLDTPNDNNKKEVISMKHNHIWLWFSNKLALDSIYHINWIFFIICRTRSHDANIANISNVYYCDCHATFICICFFFKCSNRTIIQINKQSTTLYTFNVNILRKKKKNIQIKSKWKKYEMEIMWIEHWIETWE